MRRQSRSTTARTASREIAKCKYGVDDEKPRSPVKALSVQQDTRVLPAPPASDRMTQTDRPLPTMRRSGKLLERLQPLLPSSTPS
jgi:hypothetical protein